jgi:post-segregation antitoxin (ccd killing protein)
VDPKSRTTAKAKQSDVKAASIARWQEENLEAFADYDKRVTAQGIFSEGKRGF